MFLQGREANAGLGDRDTAWVMEGAYLWGPPYLCITSVLSSMARVSRQHSTSEHT